MMAASIFIKPPFTALLLCHNKLCLGNLQGLRKYGKKIYNYDLNSLIEWNKDTALAFGGPLKLTKTGKIRKTKKSQDQQATHTLEELNAVSNYVANSSPENCMIDTMSAPSYLKSSMRNEYSNKDNISQQCQFKEIPDYQTTATSASPRSSGLSNGSCLKEVTDDGIFIPKIAPVPTNLPRHKNVELQFKGLISDPYVQSSAKKVSGVSSSSIARSNEGTIIEDEKNEIQEVTRFTSKTKHTNLAALPSNKSDPSIPNHLPVEPPDSFNVISSFPLFFDKDKDIPELHHKMQTYESDVSKLGFRMLPSVKTILNKTRTELNRYILNRWREGMIKDLGEEGFKLHQDATIKRGINFHANVMEFLSGKPKLEIQVMPDNEGHWASIQSALTFITNVQALEEEVKHPFLIYRGVFDCLARYKDLLCIVDWKSSKKPKPLLKNLYDDPLQLAAYVGALNATNKSENVMEKINHGAIIVAYSDGSPAHIHMLNRTQLEQYWQEWTDRLYNYYQLMYSSKFG